MGGSSLRWEGWWGGEERRMEGYQGMGWVEVSEGRRGWVGGVSGIVGRCIEDRRVRIQERKGVVDVGERMRRE